MRKVLNALLVLCYACQPVLADERGTALLMQSQSSGLYYMYASKNGIGMFYPVIGLHTAACGPDWNVILFNDTTKTYQVVQNIAVRADESPPTPATLALHKGIEKGPTAIIAGHKATQYLIPTMSASGPTQAEVWISTELPAPKELMRLYGKLYRIDTSAFPAGLPLRMKLTTGTGKRELLFDALRAEPKTLSFSRLKVPSGYSPASESAVRGGKGLADNKPAGPPAEVEARDQALIRGQIPNF